MCVHTSVWALSVRFGAMHQESYTEEQILDLVMRRPHYECMGLGLNSASIRFHGFQFF